MDYYDIHNLFRIHYIGQFKRLVFSIHGYRTHDSGGSWIYTDNPKETVSKFLIPNRLRTAEVVQQLFMQNLGCNALPHPSSHLILSASAAKAAASTLAFHFLISGGASGSSSKASRISVSS